MNKNTQAIFIAMFAIFVASVAYNTIQNRYTRAFDDSKLESRYIFGMEETRSGLIELRLATKTVLNANKIAESTLGYETQEMQGILLNSLVTDKIANTDFEKAPPIRVYRCYMTNKNGTFSDVIIRIMTAKKIDRIFITINSVEDVGYIE